MSEDSVITNALNDTILSRRSFIKWSAALGGTAALAGGLTYGLQEVGAKQDAAEPEGEWITAACWHNCGGQRCVLKAKVKDGMVQKVKTDDTHPDSVDHPQIRACARGRSQQHQVFGADRLKYPMKRKNWEPGGGDKERRGRDEWVRISWDEALDIVAGEMKRIIEEHGNEAILEVGGTLRRLMTQAGGAVGTWGTTSWGTWYYTGPKVGLGDGLVFTSHNDRLDMQNSDLIVIWGGNPAWSSQGNNCWFYLAAKRAGARFLFIDPYYNDSAMVLADDWVPVRPGTDHTLALGMAYTLITEDDPDNNPLIDWDFLDRCTLGFDEEHMPEDADPEDNFKDYVLGTYDGVPKTPEWAADICGVAPNKIREIARLIGKTPRVALLTAWAPARTNNQDSWPQMFMTLGAMTGHIGQPGRMTGVSCWEKTANGGPALIGSGSSGTPPLSNPPEEQVGVRINNNEVWDAVISGEYVAGEGETGNVDIRMILHDGSSSLNQKVGMTKGIEAHRKVDFVLTLNYVLNTNAKYSDVVLPVTTMWERHGWLDGNREHLIWGRQIMDPLFEAKDDDWIAVQLADRLGFDGKEMAPLSPAQEMFNRLAGAWVMNENGEQEPLLTITADDIAEMDVDGDPQNGRITLQEYKEMGVYSVPREKGDAFTYIAHKEFREDPDANPLEHSWAGTPSGKLEIHCQSLAEFVASKGFDTIDPIPTYNPAIEGYEDTFSDWEGKVKGEYPLQLFTIHYRRRSHSIFDNVPWLRELFPQEFIMNPIDAEALGITHGDTAKITSRHGAVLRPVFLTPRMMPGVVALGEGAWAEIDEETGIDIAGATNTLNGAIPTGQGHQGWNTCNVKVERYGGPDALEPDVTWPRRIPFKEV
jgi:anaerobic dimethyl sulfoxide reductase subunit A